MAARSSSHPSTALRFAGHPRKTGSRAGAAARLPAAIGVTLMLGLGFGLPSATAVADDPVADCLADQRIWVAVYYDGAPVSSACTSAATGFERLAEFASVQTAGQGFVCQIDARPEGCEIPTGDGPYWNFWWWRDGEWVYATTGGSYRGEPGSVEAWHFSAGVQPPVLDAQLPSPTASPGVPGPDREPTPEAGLPGWAPSALTIGVLALIGGGYALWRRRQH